MLLRPRATLRALAGAPAGSWDGWILLGAYLVGAKLVEIADSLADAWAMHGLGILQALVPLVFVVLPWILTGLALEVLLRRNLDARDELLRVPLVACALAADVIGIVGTVPGPVYAPELVGGVWSLALAWSQRDILSADHSRASELAEPPPVFGQLAAAAGGLMVVLLVVNTAHEIHVAARDWSRMAPMTRGDALPAFELPRVGGGTLSDDDLREHVTLLVFWTTWCGQCDAEMPTLERLYQRFGDHGVRVVGVNCDREQQRRAVRQYLERRELAFPLVYDDGRLRASMRVAMYPHLVLIDRDGTLRYVHQGRVSEGTLADEIRVLLAGAS